MEFLCRHCDGIVEGARYRVLSEEDGVILLDMIVCRPCYDQARELGLHGEEVTSDEQLAPGPASRMREVISQSLRSISALF